MAHTTLISTDELAPHLDDAGWAIVDCRFALAEPELGRRQYLQAHIPGAVYAHLNDDLSGPVAPGTTGRHPLPAEDALVRTLSGWGIDDGVQVVAYDDAGGSYAGRLWWMLRWLGHDGVAVLDGGWPAWLRAGRPISAGVETRPPGRFIARHRPALLATAEDVLVAQRTGSALIDARAADRYRGENETIDPVAGHIPGAISAPYAGNLRADGCFLPPDVLRARFERLLGAGAPVAGAIFYCGSGVSAAHDLLAAAHAGLGDARLYVGSWSEWITDPQRPIATGDRP